MFTRCISFVLFWGGSFAVALPMVSTSSHSREAFQVQADPRRLSLHVISPTDVPAEVSGDSADWLDRNASQIVEDAEINGFYVGKSRVSYDRELERYRSGRWPAVFSTEEGGTEV
jgi:hypothetical protein